MTVMIVLQWPHSKLSQCLGHGKCLMDFYHKLFITINTSLLHDDKLFQGSKEINTFCNMSEQLQLFSHTFINTT